MGIQAEVSSRVSLKRGETQTRKKELAVSLRKIQRGERSRQRLRRQGSTDAREIHQLCLSYVDLRRALQQSLHTQDPERIQTIVFLKRRGPPVSVSLRRIHPAEPTIGEPRRESEIQSLSLSPSGTSSTDPQGEPAAEFLLRRSVSLFPSGIHPSRSNLSRAFSFAGTLGG